MPPEDGGPAGTTCGRVVRDTGFAPAAWLPGPHLPTIWASVCRRTPRVALSFERIELPDGDFVDLAATPDNGGPTVLVLHGLEGDHASTYARALLAALANARFRGVLMHFRGCGGEPNRLDRSYHSGDTGDVAHVADVLARREGRWPFALIGYSLGGNVALKWLGELGADAPFSAAAAVSVPFDLAACADRLDEGFSRFYQWRLVRSMQQKYLHKFTGRESPLGPLEVRRLRTFWHFDDAVTAPLHGFRDVHDYYAQSSCRAFLGRIEIPTLIVHAEDDPFVPRHAIPPAEELGAAVELELTKGGGHVGFVTGSIPGLPRYWLESRLVQHLERHKARRRTTRRSG